MTALLNWEVMRPHAKPDNPAQLGIGPYGITERQSLNWGEVTLESSGCKATKVMSFKSLPISRCNKVLEQKACNVSTAARAANAIS